MQLRRFLLFLALFVLSLTPPHSLKAQVGDGMKQPRLLILLDESSSMIEPWTKDKLRHKVAEDIIVSLFDSIYGVNRSVEFGLRAFGEQFNVKDSNCYDTKREVSFSMDNRTQLILRLEDLHPLGVTPIAYSLKKAAEEDLTQDYKYFYSLVLITDGGESCGGNICEIAKMLMERKIHFKPYIISLVDNPNLKMEYDCLGNYLQVTTPADIPQAVGIIMEQYRPMLNIIKADYKKLESSLVATPSVLKVDIPSFQITKEVPEPKPVAKKEEVIVKEEPKPAPPKTRVKETITYVPGKRILTAKPAKLDVTPATHNVTIPHIAPPPPNEVVVAPPPPKVRIKETIAYAPIKKLYVLKPNKFYISPVTRDLIIPHIPMPPASEIAIIPKTPKPNKTEKPPVPTEKPPTEKLVSYVLQTAEATETSVEIYFTDGKGKFYSTTPEIVVSDAGTGNEVKRFNRNVNAAGNPIAQKLAGGTYNISLPAKTALVARNVPIQPNKVNKLTIVVSSGSLHFAYENNPGRPVSEFIANVTERILGGHGANITQRCDVDLEYATNNYHIIINTQPVIHRNVDIEFDNVTVITIAEPGFLQITNTGSHGNGHLYTTLGDGFVKFMDVDVNGNEKTQNVRLQPGLYEIRYNKTPNLPMAEETKVRFTIKSNETTQLELKY